MKRALPLAEELLRLLSLAELRGQPEATVYDRRGHVYDEDSSFGNSLGLTRDIPRSAEMLRGQGVELKPATWRFLWWTGTTNAFTLRRVGEATEPLPTPEQDA